MISHLGSYITDRRKAAGLRIVEVARLAELGKRAKALRLIELLEKTGQSPRADLFEKVSRVLQLDPQLVDAARQRDREDYHRWLDEPVPMTMAVRLIPGFYIGEDVPGGLSEEEARAWALERFFGRWKRTGNITPWKLCLNVSRRKSIYIGGEEGDCRIVESMNGEEVAPRMYLNR